MRDRDVFDPPEGHWVLRRIGDGIPWVIVPDGVFQTDYSRS